MVLAVRDELPAILSVQHEAFARVAGCSRFPASRDATAGRERRRPRRLSSTGRRVLHRPVADGRGDRAAFARRDRGDTVEIGRLVVGETALGGESQRRSCVRSRGSFPVGERFELFTGAEADVPLALYEKLGYRHT